MTLKEFREFTKDLPEDTGIAYHAYYKGCCLSPYVLEHAWIYNDAFKQIVVINPESDYDDRESKDGEG